MWIPARITRLGIADQRSTLPTSGQNDGWKTVKTGSYVNSKTKCRFLLTATRWAWIFEYLVHFTKNDRSNIAVVSLTAEQMVQRRTIPNKMTECIFNALAFLFIFRSWVRILPSRHFAGLSPLCFTNFDGKKKPVTSVHTSTSFFLPSNKRPSKKWPKYNCTLTVHFSRDVKAVGYLKLWKKSEKKQPITGSADYVWHRFVRD